MRIALAAAVTAAVLATGTSPALGQSGAPPRAEAVPPTYTAVIDAGSSGSRIYLYDGRATAKRVLVRTLFQAELDDVPGLSSFLANPGRAGAEGVAPLLWALEDELTARGIEESAVPVYLLATAGMRNVQLESPRAVKQIYASARKAIRQAGLPVGGVRTISGKHEGLYSWTDVNYLRGTFRGTAASRGIAEVGGASAQVAFLTTATGPNVATARIAGRKYRVFSVSYLGLGQNDARQDLVNPSDRWRGNACFPNNSSGQQPVAYDLKNDVPVSAGASRYRFRDCVDEVKATIARISGNRYNTKHTSGATKATIRQTPGFARARFVGLASISHALSDFGVTGGHEARKLAHALRRVCGGTNAWAKVLARFGGEVSAFSENGCVNASYNRALVLSRAGLHIASARFRAVDTVAGQPLTWTRGFAVLQAARAARG